MTHKEEVNWYDVNKESLYIPIQSLIIKNVKFYENNLGSLFPLLFQIYTREDISKIVSPTESDLHFYREFTSFSTRDQADMFILAQIKNNPKFNYGTFLNQIFSIEEAIKYLPNRNIFGIEKINTFDDLCLFVTNRKTKTFKKIVIEYVIKDQYDKLRSIKRICEIIENDDLCASFIDNFIESFKEINDNFNFDVSSTRAREVLEHVTLKQFSKYFINDFRRSSFTKDTISMFLTLNNYGVILNIKDYKDLKSYHDAISREISLHKYKPFDLNQVEIIHMDGKKIDKLNLVVFVPKKNMDLIETGLSLNICIGSMGYADRIVNKDYYMIFLRNLQNEVIIVIHFSKNFTIIELKRKNNNSVSKEDQSLIQSFINENKKHIPYKS